jgi:hypothetical protein
LLSAKALRTVFWSVFDVEIGGKLGGPMQPSPAHLAGHGGGFSQLQLQQQEVLFLLF